MSQDSRPDLLTKPENPSGDRQQRPALSEEPAKTEERPAKRRLRRRIFRFPRRHPFRFLAAIIAVVALVVGGRALWNYFQSYESTDDAQVNGHLNPVSARINGTVIGVYTDNNRSVVQNQTLVDLDPRDYQAAADQARASLAQARGQLAAANPNVPITETTNVTDLSTATEEVTSGEAALAAAQHDYDSAVADLRQAEANNVEAQADEKRYRELVAKDEVSHELYDQKLAAARAQAAQVDARRSAAQAGARAVEERKAALAQAESRLEQVRRNSPRQVLVRQADVQSQQGAVEAAQAALETALLQLSYCTIVAPVAGVVGDKNVEVGQRVQPGEQLLVITQIEDQWVDANFKETQITRMRPGQRVTIHVDALGRNFNGYVENMPGGTGAVYSLLPPENATGNYVKVVQRLPVRIRFNKGQAGLERLRPGMSVEPKVWLR
jgi:membrane fusion protein, multidrug efflux system